MKRVQRHSSPVMRLASVAVGLCMSLYYENLSAHACVGSRPRKHESIALCCCRRSQILLRAAWQWQQRDRVPAGHTRLP